MTGDPYSDPTTGVLHNKLGIADEHQLQQVEYDLSLAEIADLGTQPLPGSYDLEHLQGFHRRIFGAIYPWAGEIRPVAIAKLDLYCLPQYIVGYATDPVREVSRLRQLPTRAGTRNIPRSAHVLCR